ncbi:dead deah box helicase [Fusarium tjaetaba]|uniref:Dead deah box helicase n=1 Tax=Fusarium tjaetaba TaxID=1567544 RepID=A0A8H5VYA8_9HYPO|nr:dead deah box helicase [Fusarium tjaetaba]KAF5638945.1 dead deah box helicase [Fusarium tjaetaba]
MASTDKKSSEEALLDWYKDLQPLTVDIVGDFAGRELFLIHGEALMQYCLIKASVDFERGFQLLHAIHAVEKFLVDLKNRDCNFDLVFFRDSEDVYASQGSAGSKHPYKFKLTRRILIQHLTRDVVDFKILEFDSFQSQECRMYLANNAIHFMLCDDGRGASLDQSIRLQHLIWKVISSGRNVAIINSISWKSSKVFMPLLSGSKGVLPDVHVDATSCETKPSAELSREVLDETLRLSIVTSDLSAREKFAAVFCRVFLVRCSKEGEISGRDLELVEALLLHMATLKVCHLQNRNTHPERFSKNAVDSYDTDFVQLFCTVSQTLAENGYAVRGQAEWDLFDLFDGHVFSYVLQALRDGSELPMAIADRAKVLSATVFGQRSMNGRSLFMSLKASETNLPPVPPHSTPTVLSFNHPVLEEFLEDVSVKEVPDDVDPVAEVVFQDLRHWHAYKPITTSTRMTRDKVPVWVENSRRRRHQRQMADVILYAASLTNSIGNVFMRETIVVGQKSAPTELNADTNSRRQSTVGDQSLRGGKKKALLAARALNEKKALAKQNDALRLWAMKCAEIEKTENPVDQYLKALDLLSDGSPGTHISVKPEILLYLCHILRRIWDQTRKQVDENSLRGLYLISMVWNWLRDISRSDKCTPDVASAAKGIMKTLAISQLSITVQEPHRKLPFNISPWIMMKDTPKLIQDHRLLQLHHGGPYMDRRFDSQPDARVPFEPDAWQRDILDSIDAEESLLVVAPTSAGKTFISFYAMKRVLEESDDGVLVYVAPTKALVNQIAAEIEARFSKRFRTPDGKSVWAIHTRDYRINNPTRCQILVTVPHMLQIMLLAPTNANIPTAWSRRVKRIIFDEVHCIGQAEDGIIWEQLLLLAPCPIIALSATVGNPNELKDWLSRLQAQKGFKMKMIVHEVRYSDLRKFIYEPPHNFSFKGLAKVSRLPVPGLDEGDSISPNFKNIAALDDVTLEARDCLTLWNNMQKTFPKELLGNQSKLDPLKVLPGVIEKSHIVEWEKRLKRKLKEAMENSGSNFYLLQESIDPSVQNERTSKIQHCKISDTVDHIGRLFTLACELHAQDALPALVFNYDRSECERAVRSIFSRLNDAETAFKGSDTTWKKKLRDFEQWQRQKGSNREVRSFRCSEGGERNPSKLEMAREEGSVEISPWESFDPEAPLDQFSFANAKMMQQKDLDDLLLRLNPKKVQPWLIDALRRGLGVHHAGMNLQYRRIVEMLFRKGYIRLVVATGTLALGINMPCKTVVFSGDSMFLSPQNYRQASGRAGRRGFDLLGNVVFNGINRDRVHEIMSSRLPALKGQFPISTTLILRLFVLLSGTNSNEFAVNAVKSLLSQTRLYLGGPDAEMTVKHHLRFSIEYLRRQNLLSVNGEPIHFAGLVGHLYFTENAVFAFHSLLRGGYFHKLCKDIDCARERVLREMMLVLSHLFNRIPIQRTAKTLEVVESSSSDIFLKRLPVAAERLLVRHNRETLLTFKDYVSSYINTHLHDSPDRTLPLTRIPIGPEEGRGCSLTSDPPPVIRSPFVALSGFTDEFNSIGELCSTVRDGVFLEESSIPYLPIWPVDTTVELNAYLYDFFKHGSLKVLVRDNLIKRGDVWFHLKDFSLVLKTIVTSLKGVIYSGGGFDMEDLDGDDNMSDTSQGDGEAIPKAFEVQKPDEASEEIAQASAKNKVKAEVPDSWEDESDASASESEESMLGSYLVGSSASKDPVVIQSEFDNGCGLRQVLRAFELLEAEFADKFYKIGA